MKTAFSKNANTIITGLVFTFLVSVIGHAQVIKAFTQRPSSYTPSKVIYNIQGDFTMIGNSNMTLQSYDVNENNSNNVMIYNDIDGDPTTLNSSSSVLGFSTENGAVPECSNIIYAGLYWTGRASNESSSPESFSVTKGGLTKTLNKRKINFKGPGQAGYTEFTANPGNIYYPDGTYGNMYSAYIEVTDYVQSCGVGSYTAADIALVEGNGGATGYYGGWGMIVIYENSKMNWRDVTLFDGHAYVVGNTSVNYELPVSGFQTVQSGDVNMKLGLMAGEGDVGIAGDYFKIRNWQNTSWVTLNHSGNSSNNFFNGSVNTGGNARNPNLQNNTGVDIAMFDIPNTGNTVLTNNQTSTRFQYGSSQDTYIIFAMAMSVDAYIPDIEAFVSAESINGIPVGSGPITVLPGEDLEYLVEIKNQGTEAINNAVFTIPIPYTTTFVGGSIVNDVTFLPLPLPNNAYFDPTAGPTGSIIWDFGTLPLIGGFPDSVLARLSFHLTVTDDCNILANPDCPPTVALGGIVSGEGAVSGSDFSLQFIQGYETSGLCVGEPIKDPLIIEIDAASYLATNCSTTPTIRDFVFCNYDLPFLPYDSVAQYFPAGLSFYNTNNVTPSSIKYDENNPFPANVGTQTYFAIPDGISFCYYTFTLTVQEDIVSNALQTSPETCIGAGNGSINLVVNGGTSPYTYLWTGPGVFTSTSEDLSSLSQGAYSVVVTDDIGCTSAASATVSVTPDLTNPNISCVANQSENVIIGTCAYTHSGTAWNATATDNCTLNSVTYALTGATTGTGTTLNGVGFNVGTTTVTWTATDGLGNTNSCNFTVTVVDNILPSITSCGVTGNQTVNVDAAQCNFTQTGTAWNATATDNCTVSSIVATLSGATTASGLTTLAGVDFNIGTTTVLWTVTDGVGNSSTCTFDVTVVDNISPSITSCGATGNQTVNVDAAQCNYTQAGNAWNATATDNCTVSSIVATLSGATTASGLTTLAGVDFNIGTTTVLWTVTDGVGNSSTCTFNVIVVDNVLPSISSCGATGNQTVNVDAAQCNFTQTGSAWNAIATDNCTVSTTLATLSGATTASGLTTLVGVDFNIGTTTVLWTVTDGVGNVSTCTFDVTVVDNISPSISSCGAAGNQTINVDAAQCNFTQTGTAWNATATDNCTVSTIIASLSGATTASGLTTLAGVDFNLGTTTVLWTVTDGSGNTSSCTFNVTVVDNILPSISSCGAAGNQTVNVDAAQCNFTQTGTAWNATATDNCTVSSIVATLSGATTASGLTTLAGVDFNIGTTTVLWTVTDGVGNSSSCTFDVTVVDNVDPTILSCGATGAQVVSSDLGVCTYTQTSNSWDAVVSDNCTIGSISYSLSGATSGSGTSLAGVTFNSGITTVLWTAVDGSMNTSTCSFTVEVEDNQAPIISGCPTNLVVGTDNGVCGAIVNWSVPTFTDNCGAAMTSNYNSGQFFPTGTSTVIYTVTDAVGNTSICSFTITVNDNELPTLACPAPIESCDPLVVYAAPVFGDNCGTASTFQTAGLPSGMNFPVGMTMNAFQTTDIHGNVSTCTFSVTIFALPVASTDVTDVSCFGLNDGEIDLTITSGTAPFTYTWSNSQSSEDLIGLAPGTYTVSVIDDHGCSTTASAEISEPEVLQLSAEFNNVNCYNGNDGLIDLNVSGGTLPYSFTWSNGAITEDLSGLSAGPYDVVVSDFNGCEISYNTTITQPDSLMIAATVIDANCGTANGTILVQVTGGNAPYQFAWSNGTTEMSLYNVVAGTYTLIVTDAMNCTNSYTGTVSTISSLNANLIEIDAKCFGENSGSIQAVVSSGFAPFTYDWSDGQTSPTAIDLTAGTYSVTITDMYGCQVTLNGTVNQPDSLYAIVTSSVYAGGYNISSNNGSDGYLNTQVFGGTSPYSFNWTGPSNFASTNQNLANLQDGAYALYLTDVNGCAFSTSSRLTEPALLEMPNGYSPNGDGDNETFVVHGIDAYPNNEIVVFNRWGNIVYKKANYANEWAGDNTVGEALPDGTYFVILTVVAGEEEITLKGYVDLRR